MLRRRIGKRGAEPTTTQLWFIVIALVLAGAVSLSFLKKTVDDITGVTYEKNYIARDIALLSDAVYAAPGNVEYSYSLRNYKFDVEIKDSKVFVKKAICDKREVPGVYGFFGDTSNGLKKVVTRKSEAGPAPVIIIFSKNEGAVSLRADGNGEVHDEPPCTET